MCRTKRVKFAQEGMNEWKEKKEGEGMKQILAARYTLTYRVLRGVVGSLSTRTGDALARFMVKKLSSRGVLQARMPEVPRKGVIRASFHRGHAG